MTYVNSLDKDGKCESMGTSAENSFYKILKKRGEVRKATTRENKSHTDFFLTVGDKIVSYDVKAAKKASRDDSGVSYELVSLEILNIFGGVGWAFSDKVDFIAFERQNDFIVVETIKLKDLIEKKCDLKLMVTSSKDALYKGYRRFQRNDLITLVKMSDLETIASEIINKI